MGGQHIMARKPPKPEDRAASPRHKGKKPRTIDDLSRAWPASKDEYERISHELETAHHRAAAIMASVSVENALEYALTFRFGSLANVSDVSMFEGLFRYPKPLSSFAAKIEIGYATGVYGLLTRDDLNTIRKIRNAFAHATIIIDFDTPEIANEVEKFKFLKWLREGQDTEIEKKLVERRRKSDSRVRDEFMRVADALQHHLILNFSSNVGPPALP
jgi:hypothetical protein